MAFYDQMQGVASKLLDQFQQGVVLLQKAQSVPGANPWDAPTITYTDHPLTAAVRGIPARYIDGVTILAGDLWVVHNVIDEVPELTDRISIGGTQYTIMQVEPIPATGLVAAYRLRVRR